MKEKIIVLKNEIKKDLIEIDKIYIEIQKIEEDIQTSKDPKNLITLSYYLHNLYTAFESIFENISRCFENVVEDTALYHRKLLKKMNIEIDNIRPKVISDMAYPYFDELRRFRHFFRHAYEIKINDDKLMIVLKSAKELKKLYIEDFKAFDKFLEGLIDEMKR